MKHYLVKWPNGTVSVVGARTLLELADHIDRIGNPTDPETLIQKLPTVPFIVDCPTGEQPHFADGKHKENFVPGSKMFSAKLLEAIVFSHRS